MAMSRSMASWTAGGKGIHGKSGNNSVTRSSGTSFSAYTRLGRVFSRGYRFFTAEKGCKVLKPLGVLFGMSRM
jgi:hypothetical protein